MILNRNDSGCASSWSLRVGKFKKYKRKVETSETSNHSDLATGYPINSHYQKLNFHDQRFTFSTICCATVSEFDETAFNLYFLLAEIDADFDHISQHDGNNPRQCHKWYNQGWSCCESASIDRLEGDSSLPATGDLSKYTK
jgi:hypothetical protein